MLFRTFTYRSIPTVSRGTRVAPISRLTPWRFKIITLDTGKTRLVVLHACVNFTFTKLSRKSRGTSAWQDDKSSTTFSLNLNDLVLDTSGWMFTGAQHNHWAELWRRPIAASHVKHGFHLIRSNRGETRWVIGRNYNYSVDEQYQAFWIAL